MGADERVLARRCGRPDLAPRAATRTLGRGGHARRRGRRIASHPLRGRELRLGALGERGGAVRAARTAGSPAVPHGREPGELALGRRGGCLLGGGRLVQGDGRALLRRRRMDGAGRHPWALEPTARARGGVRCHLPGGLPRRAVAPQADAQRGSAGRAARDSRRGGGSPDRRGPHAGAEPPHAVARDRPLLQVAALPGAADGGPRRHGRDGAHAVGDRGARHPRVGGRLRHSQPAAGRPARSAVHRLVLGLPRAEHRRAAQRHHERAPALPTRNRGRPARGRGAGARGGVPDASPRARVRHGCRRITVRALRAARGGTEPRVARRFRALGLGRAAVSEQRSGVAPPWCGMARASEGCDGRGGTRAHRPGTHGLRARGATPSTLVQLAAEPRWGLAGTGARVGREGRSRARTRGIRARGRDRRSRQGPPALPAGGGSDRARTHRRSDRNPSTAGRGRRRGHHDVRRCTRARVPREGRHDLRRGRDGARDRHRGAAGQDRRDAHAGLVVLRRRRPGALAGTPDAGDRDRASRRRERHGGSTPQAVVPGAPLRRALPHPGRSARSVVRPRSQDARLGRSRERGRMGRRENS